MTIAEDLTVLIAARSALISSISTGEAPVLEYEIRGKRVRFESTIEMLNALNSQIKLLQGETQAAPSRNRFRTQR